MNCQVTIPELELSSAGRAEQIPRGFCSGTESVVFFGDLNHLPGRLIEGRVHLGNTIWTDPPAAQVSEGSVDDCVRPYDLTWSNDASTETLMTTVRDARWLGGRYRVELSTAPEGVPFITAEWSRTQMPDREPTSGDVMHLKPRRFALFSRP